MTYINTTNACTCIYTSGIKLFSYMHYKSSIIGIFDITCQGNITCINTDATSN